MCDCERLKLLSHNCKLTNEEMYRWLLKRRTSYQVELRRMAYFSERSKGRQGLLPEVPSWEARWAVGQAGYYERVLAEIDEALDRLRWAISLERAFTDGH